MYVSAVNCLAILLCVVTIVVGGGAAEQRAGSNPRQITRPSSMSSSADDEEDSTAANLTAAAAASRDTRGRPKESLPLNKQSQAQTFEILNPKPTDVSIECKALRSKRYITDGFCTSVKPIEDMVCTGNCLPIGDLPWYAEFIKVWSRAKTLQYRCVDDVIRYKKVTFTCDSGETRSYKIRVVRSCKCKRYLRNQNESPADYMPKRTDNRKQRRPKKLSNLSDGPK